MRTKFFQSAIIKNSLWAGFLVVFLLLAAGTWFYINFCMERDVFINKVPNDVAIYWHITQDQEENSQWLVKKSINLLGKEEQAQVETLLHNIIPQVSELSIVIFPSRRDFIVFVKPKDNNEQSVADIVDKLGLFKIILHDGLAISNNQDRLKSTDSSKKLGLIERMELNYSGKCFPIQFYIKNGIKFNDFPVFTVKSRPFGQNTITMSAGDDSLMALDIKLSSREAETMIKEFLAVSFPVIKIKKLSDGTKVREIIADPDEFSFKDEKIGEFAVRYTKVDPLQKEIWLSLAENKMIISTSREMMDDFLAQEAAKNCYGWNLGDLARWLLEKGGVWVNGVVVGIPLLD